MAATFLTPMNEMIPVDRPGGGLGRQTESDVTCLNLRGSEVIVAAEQNKS